MFCLLTFPSFAWSGSCVGCILVLIHHFLLSSSPCSQPQHVWFYSGLLPAVLSFPFSLFHIPNKPHYDSHHRYGILVVPDYIAHTHNQSSSGTSSSDFACLGCMTKPLPIITPHWLWYILSYTVTQEALSHFLWKHFLLKPEYKEQTGTKLPLPGNTRYIHNPKILMHRIRLVLSSGSKGVDRYQTQVLIYFLKGVVCCY